MMALGQATGMAQHVMRTISARSQGVKVNLPPQNNQKAPSQQVRVVSHVGDSIHNGSRRPSVLERLGPQGAHNIAQQ